MVTRRECERASEAQGAGRSGARSRGLWPHGACGSSRWWTTAASPSVTPPGSLSSRCARGPAAAVRPPAGTRHLRMHCCSLLDPSHAACAGRRRRTCSHDHRTQSAGRGDGMAAMGIRGQGAYALVVRLLGSRVCVAPPATHISCTTSAVDSGDSVPSTAQAQPGAIGCT